MKTVQEKINLIELLGTKMYKKLSLEKLTEVVDYDLEFDDYEKLEGTGAENKSRLLMEEWAKVKF